MTFETTDDVLEHFGVKGMKWGVRKQRPKLTAAQRRARTERRQRTASRVLAGAAATIYVAALLSAGGSTRMSDIPPFPGSSGSGSYRSTGSSGTGGNRSSSSGYRARPRSAADVINQERETKLAAVRGHHNEGYIDADQLRRFTDSINTRYDRRVAEAGG